MSASVNVSVNARVGMNEMGESVSVSESESEGEAGCRNLVASVPTSLRISLWDYQGGGEGKGEYESENERDRMFAMSESNIESKKDPSVQRRGSTWDRKV